MREGRATDAEPLATLLISHDARCGGAQRCLIEVAHVLKNELGRHVELATCADGELLPELERIAPVARLHAGEGDIRAAASTLVSKFRSRWPDGRIVVNTSAVADVYRALEDTALRDALAWVHELPASIEDHYGGAATVALIDRVARQIVVPCDLARDVLRSRYRLPASKIVVLTNGVARSIARGAAEIDRTDAGQFLRTLVGAAPGAFLVLGCGIGDHRKGVDLFGIVAAEVCRRTTGMPVHFVWLGQETEPEVRTLARQAVEAAGFAERLHFAGSSDAPELYYAAADLFLITSRVDPSPLVNAEAMMFGLPVVFFEDSGGAREQQPPEVDLGVAGFDTHAMATRVLELLRDGGKRHEIGRLLGQHARRSSSWSRFVEGLDRVGLEASPGVLATADLVVKKHGSRGANRSPERRLLLILPDIEIGGGQLNAIRLANALTATHQVFVLNARPERYDPSVAELISPLVIPLEGSLHRAPWYEGADLWTKDAARIDERPHRVRVVAELLKHFQIGTVLSQVWWSDRFALALHDVADFDWFVKFCGCYEHLLRHPLTDPDFAPKARRILRSVTGVTYGSETNLQIFEDAGFPRPRAMRRIFNGFSRALIERPSGQSPPRSPRDFVFCVCSRAIKEKGWEEALLAVEQINRRPAADRGGKRARLWLIGDGPELVPLKTRYAEEEAAVFLGQKTRPHSLMAAADAGLLPSYAESQPTTVIESLACGRPVVATAVGAIPQMLAHGHLHAGILVPPLPSARGVAVEALADAMLRYMVDEEIYREHQKAAGSVFDAQFEMSATVHNYLAFFAEAGR